jgi:hypothetical protein
MGLTVLQRPNQNNAWVCTGNPILYKMIRKDFAISAIANSAGALQITVTGNLATLAAALGGPVVAGSILYFKDDGGIYAGSFTVVTCTNAASSVVTFTAGTYTSGAGAATGYVNLTSNRSSYRVEVELFRQVDNVLIFSKYEFAPAADGSLNYMNVATVLNGVTALEPLSNPTFGISAAVGAPQTFRKLWRNTSPGAIGFYIKYREVWNGSAEAQTNDNANPAWAAKGARQVGDLYGGYLKEYSDAAARKFLTKFTAPKIWPGRIMALSFIEPTNPPSGSDRIHIKREYYTPAGVYDFALYELPNLTGADQAAIYDHAGTPVDVADPSSTPQYLIYDKQFAGGVAWTNLGDAGSFPTVTLAPTNFSNKYAIPLHLKAGRSYTIYVTWQIFAGAGAETVTISARLLRLDQATIEAQTTSAALGQNQTRTEIFTMTPASADTYWLVFYCECSAGANNRTALISYPAIGHAMPAWIDFHVVNRDDGAKTETAGASETLRHYMVPLPAPDNIVQLLWTNSIRGAATWCFIFSQDYNWRHADGTKRKRMVLYAQHLSANEWETLNELNHPGDIYEVPIPELTSAVNKTHARNGSQVYMVDAAGKLTGVTVVPTEKTTKSRRIQHSIEITIELPEFQVNR